MGKVYKRTFVIGDLVTISPDFYKGMWSGDHLIKVEDYDIEKEKVRRDLHCIEL